MVLNESADADAVTREIDSLLKSGPVATTTRRKGAFQVSTLSDLVDLIGFAHWLGFAYVGLVLSLVATTTVMNVQDRIKEYAVLQTIGIRPFLALRLVLTESTILVPTRRPWRNSFGHGASGYRRFCDRQPQLDGRADGDHIPFRRGDIRSSACHCNYPAVMLRQ